MGLNDSVDFGGVDGGAITDAIVDKVRKHGENFHNCFCWNCGLGVKVATIAPCKRCGALLNGPGRFLSPCVPYDPGRVTARHPSIRRYKKRTIIAAFIFALLFSAGLSIFMFVSGDMKFDDEGMHTMAMVLTVIWMFWLVWLLHDFANTRKKVNSTGAYNQNSGEMDIYCAICDNASDRRANYCGLCGCAIPK